MIKTIDSIIKDFAQQGFVFSNEKDFQFEFALALSKSEQEVAEVKLEALSLPYSWQTIQTNVNLKRGNKEYTDIIVRTKEGEYIAIELKFKTADRICYYSTNKLDNLTMKQNAYHFNAYDFINDIVRLENINDRYFYNGFKVSKGYAILLTNNCNYRYNDFSGSSIWESYAINDGKCLSGALLFNGNQQTYKIKKRTFKALKLESQYTLDWKGYPLPNYQDYQDIQKSCNPGFSYLIVEVKP